MPRKRTSKRPGRPVGWRKTGAASACLHLRCTPEQRAEIERRAQTLGVTLTDYVLDRALIDPSDPSWPRAL